MANLVQNQPSTVLFISWRMNKNTIRDRILFSPEKEKQPQVSEDNYTKKTSSIAETCDTWFVAQPTDEGITINDSVHFNTEVSLQLNRKHFCRRRLLFVWKEQNAPSLFDKVVIDVSHFIHTYTHIRTKPTPYWQVMELFTRTHPTERNDEDETEFVKFTRRKPSPKETDKGPSLLCKSSFKFYIV